MSTTQAQRSRAHRLRARVKKGETLADGDAKWLRDYENGDVTAPFGVVDVEPVPQRAPAPRAEPAGDPFGPVSFEEPKEQAPDHDVPACAIKDCPRCRGVAIAPVCGVTSQPVYPRMTESASTALAGLALGFVTIIARIFGKLYAPEKEEAKKLGNALAEVIYRRAGWTGAVDDYLALGFAIAGIATAVYKAPKLVVNTEALDNDPR